MNLENITTHPASKLTAVWHQHERCDNCPGTLVMVYQSSNKQLQLANNTQDGWQHYPVCICGPWNGLALALFWSSTQTFNLQLFYQIKTQQLVSLIWYSQSQRETLGSKITPP